MGALLTLLGIGVCLAGLVAVHLLPTGLNPLRDPVSQYHLTRFRPVILVSTLAAGVAGIGAIIVFAQLAGSGATVVIVLLAVFALCRILIPFLRMDAPDTPVTAVGRIHTVLAFGAFGSTVAVAFVAGGLLHDTGYATAATWSTAFGVVGAIGAVGMLVVALSRRRGLFGFFERVIYLGFICWFVLVGVTAVSAGV